MKEYFVFLNEFSSPSVFMTEEEIQRRDLSFSVKRVSTDVKWRDSDYEFPRLAATRCVAEGLVKSFSTIGNSGIAQRNWVVLQSIPTIPTIVVEATVAKKILFSSSEESETILELSEEKAQVEIPDPEIREKCLQILKEEKDKEGQKELWSLFKEEGSDVVEVSEFNKTLACHATQPKEVFSILKKATSCGNSTVLLVRVANKKIRCPDKYKGLVIGAKGANINKISEVMGFRVNVV